MGDVVEMRAGNRGAAAQWEGHRVPPVRALVGLTAVAKQKVRVVQPAGASLVRANRCHDFQLNDSRGGFRGCRSLVAANVAVSPSDRER